MPNLKNSEIIGHMLQILVSKIGRRTSEGFAVVTIDNILKELEQEYSFLKYIKIKNMLYYDKIDAVSVMSDINSVEPTKFYRAIKDIIKMTVRNLDRNAGFYFINEFQKAIDDNVDLALKENDIDLGLIKRHTMDEIFKIENSEVVKHVLTALTRSLNRTFPEAQAIKTVIDLIKKLEGKYNFLKYIDMTNTPDLDALYSTRASPSINPNINNVSPTDMGEALQKLIEEAGKSIEYESDQSFIEDFKNELEDEYLSKIKEVGVNLDLIRNILLRKEHKILTEKTLEALVDVVGRRTSKGFAVVTLDTIIGKLLEKHDVLKYIKIDKSRYMEGFNAISIMPDIDSVESYKLGKALQDIIKVTKENLKNKARSFIEDFKNKLGDNYISKIKETGVNLFLLEMRPAI
ncbi:MAG: hypothetical protein JSW60_02975 [Thermoplasmatales archaeon]|nr:MAG: hypothetical protein JSW60_02975 [Thermoplasmatales archaeon]